MNIAGYLLQSRRSRVQDAAELAGLVKEPKSSWEVHFRVVNMLLARGKMSQAIKPISKLDAAEYFQKATNPTQFSLLFDVFVRFGRPEEAISLLEKGIIKFKESTQINLRITCAFRLLTEGYILQAIGFCSKLDYNKNLFFSDIPQDKIRLIFLTHLLSKEKELDFSKVRDSLGAIIRSANKPIVKAALGGFADTLMRKVECSFENKFYMTATQWIAEALNIECSINPLQETHLITLARWMVLSGRVGEIIKIMKNFYESDQSAANCYTYLSILLWIKGYFRDGFFCINQERLIDSCDPELLFARATAFAIFGSPETAVFYLTKLYFIDKNFFNRPDINTHWGFLSVIFKILGRKSLSYKAICMAEKYDRFNSFRRHLWSRIPLSPFKIEFPSFTLPDDFNKILE